jgi:hypothetical protein
MIAGITNSMHLEPNLWRLYHTLERVSQASNNPVMGIVAQKQQCCVKATCCSVATISGYEEKKQKAAANEEDIRLAKTAEDTRLRHLYGEYLGLRRLQLIQGLL